jgi:protoporphyrin/coproporphyrin ferrochelatase
MSGEKRIAVVLFNLGGPDNLDAVQPFLFNLFNDPAIISSPTPIRWLLAKLISKRRAPIAQEIYQHLGGKSPLLEQTETQARALETVLQESYEAKMFIAMRYWHPFSSETVAEVKSYAPDEVVLLPLYPQFSTTTTESSVKDWMKNAGQQGLDAPTRAICCYPTNEGLIDAQADLVRKGLEEADHTEPLRILFSAHGLPKKIIEGGDPYQGQVEKTAAAIVSKLEITDLDWRVCYQSRVGPLEWIGPSIDEELYRAGADKVGVVIVPIAFVSEHSETLVELDIEFRDYAKSKGVPTYHRIPTVGAHGSFIRGLADIIHVTLKDESGLYCAKGGKFCDRRFSRCVWEESLIE